MTIKEKLEIMLAAPSTTCVVAYRTFLKDMLEHCNRFGWHDLRKNPNDLPTHNNIVEVELWGEVLGIHHDHTWFEDGNWKHYANNSYGKVIGWREIEPMEE